MWTKKKLKYKSCYISGKGRTVQTLHFNNYIFTNLDAEQSAVDPDVSIDGLVIQRTATEHGEQGNYHSDRRAPANSDYMIHKLTELLYACTDTRIQQHTAVPSDVKMNSVYD